MSSTLIKTPPEIYDNIFETLSDKMYESRTYGRWSEAELLMRTIEFLERYLEKDDSPQPPPEIVFDDLGGLSAQQ